MTPDKNTRCQHQMLCKYENKTIHQTISTNISNQIIDSLYISHKTPDTLYIRYLPTIENTRSKTVYTQDLRHHHQTKSTSDTTGIWLYISMFLNNKILSSVGWRDPQMIAPEELFLCNFGRSCIHLNIFSEIKNIKFIFFFYNLFWIFEHFVVRFNPEKATKEPKGKNPRLS